MLLIVWFKAQDVGDINCDTDKKYGPLWYLTLRMYLMLISVFILTDASGLLISVLSFLNLLIYRHMCQIMQYDFIDFVLLCLSNF